MLAGRGALVALSGVQLQFASARKAWGAFDWALPASPEEAPCARRSSNFYSSAALVERANPTDSAARARRSSDL